MTVHLLGLPHTQTTKDWSTCAFTQKLITTATMLRSEGFKVVVYSGEQNDAPCDEHVVVATEDERRKWFGDETWRDRVFDQWDIDAPCWTELNSNIVSAVRERVESGDVISLTMGLTHKATADALPDVRSAELGIGYEASFSNFRVFESYAWMHHTYGRQNINDGRYYDSVIPNAFDPADFQTGSDEGYVLYLGRLTERKGLEVVREIAKRFPVITAGQGDVQVEGANHVGAVGPERRRELLSHATCLLAPTGYIEPFGGVAVEAQLSGIPAITTDWGAFPETVRHGETGFRCHRLEQFVDAVIRSPEIRGRKIRNEAIERWSLNAVAPQYANYLQHLATLDGEGWYV